MRLWRGAKIVFQATVPGEDWSTELAMPGGSAPFVYARLDGGAMMRAMTGALYIK